jgi:hypothetical protein
MHDGLKSAEEAKRERNWDEGLRWQVVQQTIRWAEDQLPVKRNSPVACLEEQDRKLVRPSAND